MSYFAAFEYTLAVTAPVFLIVFLGLFLKRAQKIDDAFIATASKLVFDICLPVLMFLAILEADVDWAAQGQLAGFSIIAAVLVFLVLWWTSPLWASHPEDRGVAVQGAFRSNLGIVGLALCANAFGAQGLAVGAVLLAVVTPIYNVLSVFALTRSLQPEGKLALGSLILDIVKNPLIVAILMAFGFLLLDIHLPKIASDAGHYLGAMALPLALIAIGGSLSMESLRQSSHLSAGVVAIKLLIIPVLVAVAAVLYGFSGVELGCLVLMFASPTAAASFVMVRAIGGNYGLASNIIVLSTVLSALSVSAMFYGIRVLGLL